MQCSAIAICQTPSSTHLLGPRAKTRLRDSESGYSYQDSIMLKLFDAAELSKQRFKRVFKTDLSDGKGTETVHKKICSKVFPKLFPKISRMASRRGFEPLLSP